MMIANNISSPSVALSIISFETIAIPVVASVITSFKIISVFFKAVSAIAFGHIAEQFVGKKISSATFAFVCFFKRFTATRTTSKSFIRGKSKTFPSIFIVGLYLIFVKNFATFTAFIFLDNESKYHKLIHILSISNYKYNF